MSAPAAVDKAALLINKNEFVCGEIMITDELKVLMQEGRNRRKQAVVKLLARAAIAEGIILIVGAMLLYFTGHDLLAFFGEGIKSNYPVIVFVWMLTIIILPLVAGLIAIMKASAPLVNFMNEDEADFMRAEFSKTS